jgi:hypothetical protein
MPSGTVGFLATRNLTREDYREQFIPAMKATSFRVDANRDRDGHRLDL